MDPLRAVYFHHLYSFYIQMSVKRTMYQDLSLSMPMTHPVIVRLLQGVEQDHGPVLDEFYKWWDQSFLQINVPKTKEMFIDFRRRLLPPGHALCVIKGEPVAAVQQHKYLDTGLDNKLKYDANTDAICKKDKYKLELQNCNNKIRVTKCKNIIGLNTEFQFDSVLWTWILMVANSNWEC